MSDAHRLFFALWPDDGLRSAIAGLVEREFGGPSHGRPTRTARLHMTLQFLGDFRPFPDDIVDRASIAATCVEEAPDFELAFDRLGSFGNGRVLWLGMRTPAPALLDLEHRLGGALAMVGLKSAHEQQDFVPHVTVARTARGPVDRAVPPLRWRVRDVVLVDSCAGDYRMLGRWPLASDAINRGCRTPDPR